MKKLKIIFSAAICIFTLTGCFGDMGLSLPFQSGGEKSAASIDEIYAAIYEGLSEKSDHITIKGKMDIDDVKKAMNMVHSDHPEIFWINGYSISSGIFDSEIEINVLNNYSSDELDAMLNEIKAAADTVISEIPLNADDFQKIVSVHDTLIRNTTYDTESAALGKNGLWGTIYGCLVNGKAVCQGYSEAFQYIMQLLDIPCGTVTGRAWDSEFYTALDGETQSISHAWNYVMVNGKYYWVDVTWDDPDEGKVTGSPIMHSYCLIDDKRLFKSRCLSSDQTNVPICDSMDDNYFVRNNSYIDSYSLQNVGNAIISSSDCNEEGETELMFADESAYRDAIEGLFDRSEMFDLGDYITFSDSIYYTTIDNMYVIKIKY